MTAPATAGASVTSGALSQLTGAFDCIGEKAGEGNTCGTLVEEGTHDVFQIQISPDGRNAYSVAINGDLIEYSRQPGNGDLTVIGCLTAVTDKCAGENIVENVPDLGHPSSLAVSPDGKNVYVAGTEKHALVELERNETTGLLTPMNGGKACVEEGGGECEVKGAKGLNEPYGVTVSPDGEDVYVTAVKGEAIAEFSRGFPQGGPPGVLAPITGQECIGGPTSGCPIETVIGMFEPIGIVVSPDGKNVYVAAGASGSEGAVVAFKREGGVLEQLPGEEGCVSEKIAGCKAAVALQGSEDLAISPDGQNVYATSGPKNSMVELKRDESGGALEQLGGSEDKCVTTETIVGCKTVKEALGDSRGVVVSPRGENVYVGSAGEKAVAAFARGTEGELTPLAGGFECVTSNATGCGTHNKLLGLAEARRVVISPDGTNLYVAGQEAGAIVELARTFTPTVTSVNVLSGSTAGSDLIRIKGFGFSEDLTGVTVKFEGTTATATVQSGTTILAETPAHAEGTAHVTVANEAGESAKTTSDDFTYTDRPEVLGVAPAIGGEAGGAKVTIAGLRLTEVTGVRFGSVPAVSFTVNGGEESISATVPPGKGSVEVEVETKHGSSPASEADRFTYVDGAPAPAPSAGLFLQGYCEGQGFKSVVLQREEVDGNGYAFENWACVAQDGTEVPIANGGGLLSMQAACEEGNVGHTVYAYPTDVNSAFSWGCNVVEPPAKGKSGEGETFTAPPPIHLASELVTPITPVAKPELAKTGNVAPVEGTILVQLPGVKTFVPLTTLTQIPFGSTIEATHGKVSVTAAEPNGITETGVYFGGRFKLTQERNGTVVATLTGGNFSVCPTARERAHKAAAHAATSGKHSVRKLWTNAHGKFSTRGNYAAGAVQGTEWLTDDLCEGTLIRVTRDKVEVTNLVKHKHVLVKVGHHYLAKAP